MDLARASDPKTSVDVTYTVKTALAETFGHETVRPWRLIANRSASNSYNVLGALKSAGSLEPKSNTLGISAKIIEMQIETGTAISLDIDVTPVKKITRRDPVTHRVTKVQWLDVGTKRDTDKDGRYIYVQPSSEERLVSYTDWLLNKVAIPENGMTPIDLPEIISVGSAFFPRKLRGRVSSVGMPRMNARMLVTVDNPERLAAFIRQGLKKMKDLGVGSIVPVEILDEVSL